MSISSVMSSSAPILSLYANTLVHVENLNTIKITWSTSNGGSGDWPGTIKPSGSAYGSSKMTVCVILSKEKNYTILIINTK